MGEKDRLRGRASSGIREQERGEQRGKWRATLGRGERFEAWGCCRERSGDG